MNKSTEPGIEVWKQSAPVWGALIVIGSLLAVMYKDALAILFHHWSTSEEYGHGFLIPVIAAFLIWQKRDELERIDFAGAWSGVAVTMLGGVVFFLGELSTLIILVQYSLVIVLTGVALAFLGWRGVRRIWPALVFLFFMIPLPGFLYNNLSAQLQLISSQLGVMFIRLLDISVYLEGNVIDLGSYKLQVVEACSGLRYLFPLATLSFISACFFKAALWKRILVFLSSAPITILMNSFRIGVIGVLVDRWGTEMAEGFLHDFEGWTVFMACMAILVLEMWVLSRIGSKRLPFREVFGLEFPAPTPAGAAVRSRGLQAPLVVVGLLAVVGVAGALTVGEREELVPSRMEFSEFPSEIGEWRGRRDHLDRIYIDTLKFDDYILADYVNNGQQQINFYVAYYGSQRKGESAHSPRSCIPGGGWQIKQFEQKPIDSVLINDTPLWVNRVLIRKGDTSQLVYYWFQQRGRVITDEYLVKWYLFWDALTRNRSDGALVRLTTFVDSGTDLEAAERELANFARAVSEPLASYVPN